LQIKRIEGKERKRCIVFRTTRKASMMEKEFNSAVKMGINATCTSKEYFPMKKWRKKRDSADRRRVGKRKRRNRMEEGGRTQGYHGQNLDRRLLSFLPI